MGRERTIYPNDPSKWTWDGYVNEYPIHAIDIDNEISSIKENIDLIVRNIFGLVGACPKDITHADDEPAAYVMGKFNNLIDDLMFNIKRMWYIRKVEEYEECIEDGTKDNLYGTTDEDTGRPWKPYISIIGMCADSKYRCKDKITDINNYINKLINELTIYVMCTPSKLMNELDKDYDTSLDELIIRVNDMLMSEDSLISFIYHKYDWEFALENWNDESYDSY